MDTRQTRRAVAWPKVFFSGVVATVVVTITMMLTGTNILAGLGGMIAGPEASQSMRYTVGFMAHMTVGIGYAIVFAVLFAGLSWHWLTKGVIFGFVITVMALVGMPLVAGMMAGQPVATANPCHARTSSVLKMENPCAVRNPCGGQNPCMAGNPCADKNPCGMTVNPCRNAPATNPCAAANPCAGGAKTAPHYAGLFSLLNHIVFAVVLSLMIGRRPHPSV